jgi:hypothetical protein
MLGDVLGEFVVSAGPASMMRFLRAPSSLTMGWT